MNTQFEARRTLTSMVVHQLGLNRMNGKWLLMPTRLDQKVDDYLGPVSTEAVLQLIDQRLIFAAWQPADENGGDPLYDSGDGKCLRLNPTHHGRGTVAVKALDDVQGLSELD